MRNPPRRSPALYTICAIRVSQFVLGIIDDVTRQPEITTLEAAARSPLLIVYFALGIAPDNIRRRLKRMCGGTLEIEEREAGGTRVSIFIPLDEKKQNE